MTDADTLNGLVVECLDRFDDEGPAALEQLCREHPEHADALRRRLAMLGSAGLIGTRAAPADVPERLGDFVLRGRLGGGGMGVVYEAEQTSLRRTVALKLVRPEHLLFPGARERFRREIDAVARLQHPGIVPVFAVGEEHGIPYFAMELVRGLTLAELVEGLAARGAHRPSAADANAVLRARLGDGAPALAGDWQTLCLGFVRAAAEALEHAHRRGVLHRDIKPGNLMLTADGRIQVLDFGISSTEGSQRLTTTGSHLGSLAYMSPEQLRGEHATLDARTDVWSLGVVLYELLTLRHPFLGATTEDTRRAALDGAPPPPRALDPSISRDAQAVCLVALDPDRRRRYASAAEFTQDLAAVPAHRPVRARPPSAALRLLRWTQRHPATAVLLAALVLVPAGAAVQQRAARLRVDEQRALAEESLTAALESVGQMLLRVGDETLADVPQMEDVREALLADALAFLERLLARHGDVPGVQRLAATARRRTGALQTLLGRSADAEASYSQAEAILAALPDASTDASTDASWDLARTRIDRGELLSVDPTRADDARTALQLGLDALLPLPVSADVLLESSRAQSGIGFLEDQLGRDDDARTAYTSAVEHALSARDLDPGAADVRLALATSLNQLGKFLQVRGDGASALPLFEEAVALLAGLVAERPEVADWRLRCALARSSLGFVHYGAGRRQQALDAALAARDDLARLVDDFPRVPRYRVELAGALAALGVLDASSDPQRTEALYLESLALLEGVHAESPGQIDLLVNLAGGHANLALNRLQRGRDADALSSLERSIALRRELAATNAGDPMLPVLLDHQVRTVEMLLGGSRPPGVEDVASALAAEALAAGVRTREQLAGVAWTGLAP